MQQRGYFHQAEYFHEVECTGSQNFWIRYDIEDHIELFQLLTFDLLTLSVTYSVSNCWLKTFTSVKNDFLNTQKSSTKLSLLLLESLSIAFIFSVTSFSFVISWWYSLSSLFPVSTITFAFFVQLRFFWQW